MIKKIYYTMMVIMSGLFVACSGGSENPRVEVITHDDFISGKKSFIYWGWDVPVSVRSVQDGGSNQGFMGEAIPLTFEYTFNPGTPETVDPVTGDVVNAINATGVLETFMAAGESINKEDPVLRSFGLQGAFAVNMSDLVFTFDFATGLVAIAATYKIGTDAGIGGIDWPITSENFHQTAPFEIYK